jgi:hypothetical protein
VCGASEKNFPSRPAGFHNSHAGVAGFEASLRPRALAGVAMFVQTENGKPTTQPRGKGWANRIHRFLSSGVARLCLFL